MNHRTCCYILSLCIVSAAVAGGDLRSTDARRSGRMLAGLGVLVKTEPYKGADERVYPLGFFLYEGRKWSLKGSRFDYQVLGEESWSLGALVKLRAEGFEEHDSSYLNGMSDRDFSLDGGVGVSLRGDWGQASVELLADLLGKHDGQEVRLGYSRAFEQPFGLADMRISPFAGMSWRSSGLNDYYYGVRSGESTPTRSAYDAGGDTNFFAGLRLDRRINERWNLFVLFQNQWLGGEITESPIVDEHHVSSIVAGLLYRF